MEYQDISRRQILKKKLIFLFILGKYHLKNRDFFRADLGRLS